MPNKWKIQPHSQYDKSFVIDGPLPLVIDNDDVFQPGVAILAMEVVRLLNDHYKPVMAKQCPMEDCVMYGSLVHDSYTHCPACGDSLKLEEVFAS